MGWPGKRHGTALWSFYISMFVSSGISSATISCDFAIDFCGWKPTAIGNEWQVGTDLQQKPPEGYNSYAWVRSGQESWAEMESHDWAVEQSSVFSFYVIQQRIEINNNDLVELHIIPANGSASILLRSIKNSVSWKYETVTLTPAMGTFRLRFRMKVGTNLNLVALAGFILPNEGATVIETTTIATTTDTTEAITHTETVTPTVAVTSTETVTPTETATSTAAITTTETVTSTEAVTHTETVTSTAAITTTETVTSTEAVTHTETVTSTAAITTTETVTSTEAVTTTETVTPTETATSTAAITTTETVTPTETATSTAAITTTETVTSTEAVTHTETVTSTAAITTTETVTSTEAVTTTETVTPTETATSTAAITTTVAVTSTETVTPTETATSTAAITTTVAVTSTETVTPTETATSTAAITTTETVTSTLSSAVPNITETVTPTETITSTAAVTTTEILTTTVISAAPDTTEITSTAAATPTTTRTTPPPVVQDGFLSCTFRSNMCSWINQGTNNANWTIVKGIDAALGTPGQPSASLDEFYLFVSGKTVHEITIDGLHATLESPYFNYDGQSSFSFWHRAAKKDADILKLLLVNEAFPANHKNVAIAALDKVWKEFTISFNTTNAVQISFGVTLSDALQTVALDEFRWTGDLTGSPITVQPSTPPTTSPLPSTTQSPLSSRVTCNFNFNGYPFCGWTNDPMSVVWSHGDGTTVGVPPLGIEGRSPFLYANSSNIEMGKRSARLISSLVPQAVQTKLKFYYRSFGSGIEDLEVTLQSSGKIKTIFSNANQSEEWQQAMVDICTNQGFQVVIEAKFSLPGFFAAIDDIELVDETSKNMTKPSTSCGTAGWEEPTSTMLPVTNPTPVTTTVATAVNVSIIPDDGIIGAISCDFELTSENQFCGWKPAYDVGSQLQVGHPPGPFNDSTSLYAVTNQASVSSPISGLGSIQRLQFDYASSGRGARSLSFYLVIGNTVNRTSLWSFDAFLNEKPWTTVIFSFQAPSQTYRLLIEAKIIMNRSIIAIDNIILEGENGTTIGTTAIVVSPTPPVLIPVIPQMTCHFDSGICPGWLDVGDDELGSWIWQTTSNSPFLENGGTGLLQAMVVSEPAVILTNVFTPGPSQQYFGRVSFWLHVQKPLNAANFSHIVFTVDVVMEGSGFQQNIFQHSTNEILATWNKFEVDFCLIISSRLSFKVSVDNDTTRSETYMAFLDEIFTTRLENGSVSLCPSPVTQQPISTLSTTVDVTNTTTVTTTSIPTTPQFTAPPDSGSNGTISCNFDDVGACGWQIIPSTTQFSVGRPLPNPDAPIFTSNAFFVVGTGSRIARAITGTVVGITGVDQLLKFDYASFGNGSRSLSAYLVIGYEINQPPVWSFNSFDSERPWTTAILSFVAPSEAYRILIEAKFNSESSIIALDNIVFEGENGGTVGTTEPYITSTLPTLSATILSATCGFDNGLCPFWDPRAGLNTDGEWSTATVNALNATWAAPEGAQSGLGYMFARGTSKHSELATGPIVLNSTEPLYGRVSFWINFYNTTPLTEYPVASAPYEFTVVLVSTAHGFEQELFSLTNSTVTSGWKYWGSDFCLVETSYLKFVLTTDLSELNFALDDVLTTEADEDITSSAVCREVTTLKPVSEFSIATIPPVSGCFRWELINESSCNFEDGICEGWLTPNNSYPFDYHSQGPTGVGSLIINGAHGGKGFAVTSCIYNNPFPTDTTSSMQLPTIRVPFTTTLYGRISFWYVFVNVRGDNRHMRLLSTTFSGTETIWAVTDGQSTLWRYAEVDFMSLNSLTLTFIVEHNKCSSPTALDTITVVQGIPDTECDTSTNTVSCDFEHNHLCAWDISEGENKWKVGSGIVGDGIHALNGTDFGDGFAYADSSTLSEPSKPAELTTHYLPGVNSDISFYYRVFGEGVTSLNLLVATNETRYRFWSSRPSIPEWRSAHVRLCFPEWHKLIFEAKFAKSGFVIGLDNIELASELWSSTALPTSNCTRTPIILPPPWEGKLFCDFENGTLCSWQNFNITDAKEVAWSVATNSQTNLSIPAYGQGQKFALAKSDTPNPTVVRLLSPSILHESVLNESSSNVILSFYYRTSSQGSSGLDFYAVSNDIVPGFPSESITAVAVSQWSTGMANLSFLEAKTRRIIIETQLMGLGAWTAIDDIRYVGEEGGTTIAPTPHTELDIIDSTTCNFDSGLCDGWFSIGEGYQWSSNVWSSLDDVDPQSGQGFVYVNKVSSSEKNATTVADLRTGNFTNNQPDRPFSINLQFWYVAGQGQTKFEVRQVGATSHSFKSEWRLEHFIRNTSEKVWRKAEVTFCLLMAEERLSISFIVTPGSNFTFAGLDEVKTYHQQGENATCPQNAPQSCSFDHTFCNWQVFGFETVPIFDTVVLPSGNSFALATSMGAPGTVYRSLRIPKLSMTRRTQISFLYFISGSTNTTAAALTVTHSNRTSQRIWSVNGNPRVPSGQWLPARISLCQNDPFLLGFDVTLSNNGSFGLANLVINDEKEAITSQPSAFVCEPLPVTNSITCNLDSNSTDFCGWAPSSTSGTAIHVGVLFQDVVNVERAAYLYVLPTPDATPAGDKYAVIESSTLDVSDPMAEFSFWYLLRGSVVELVASAAGKNITVTTLKSNAEDYSLWAPASFVLPSIGSTSLKLSFRVHFLETPSKKLADSVPLEFFALDEVWYSAEPGFEADSLPDIETTSSPAQSTSTASQETSTMPQPTSTVSITPPVSTDGTMKSTSRPPQVRPTTTPSSDLTEREKIAIGVGSAGGVFALILVAVLVRYLCKKRQREHADDKRSQYLYDNEMSTRPVSSAGNLARIGSAGSLPMKKPIADDSKVSVKFTMKEFDS